jgi:hypothetical protein
MNNVYDGAQQLCDKCFKDIPNQSPCGTLVSQLRDHLNNFPVVRRHVLKYFISRIKELQPRNFDIYNHEFVLFNYLQWQTILVTLCNSNVLANMHKAIGPFFIEFLRQCFEMKSLTILKLSMSDVPTFVINHATQTIANANFTQRPIPTLAKVEVENAETDSINRSAVGHDLFSIITTDSNSDQFLEECKLNPCRFEQAVSYVFHRLQVRRLFS